MSALLLVWTEVAVPEGLGPGPWRDTFSLAPTLHLVADGAGRSPVYHAVKGLLPAGAALAVAPLEEPPKVKGAAPGLVAWLRTHDAGP